MIATDELDIQNKADISPIRSLLQSLETLSY
jgi:hypothetical protein